MSSLLLDSKYNNHEYLKKIKIYGYFSCLHPSWTCKDSGADGSCYLALIGLVSNPSIYYLWPNFILGYNFAGGLNFS